MHEALHRPSMLNASGVGHGLHCGRPWLCDLYGIYSFHAGCVTTPTNSCLRILRARAASPLLGGGGGGGGGKDFY